MQKAIAWVDVEFSGTSPEVDSFLEIAVALTDFDGNLLKDPYSSLVIVKDLHRVLDEAQELVKLMHEKSGLWNDLWTQQAKKPEEIDQDLSELLREVGETSIIYFGGNSPFRDRRYAELYLPRFYERISHMSVDVTTLSLVLQEKGAARMFIKRGEHRALPDVLDSIDEYRHYLHWVE